MKLHWVLPFPLFFVLTLTGFKKVEFIEVFRSRRGDRNVKNWRPFSSGSNYLDRDRGGGYSQNDVAGMRGREKFASVIGESNVFL
jgi:hypothetical protein